MLHTYCGITESWDRLKVQERRNPSCINGAQWSWCFIRGRCVERKSFKFSTDAVDVSDYDSDVVLHQHLESLDDAAVSPACTVNSNVYCGNSTAWRHFMCLLDPASQLSLFHHEAGYPSSSGVTVSRRAAYGHVPSDFGLTFPKLMSVPITST